MGDEVWVDPIVEEVRKVRDEYASAFNYDLAAIFEDLVVRQESSGRTFVQYEPKGAIDEDAEDLGAREERAKELSLPLGDVVKDLKRRGKI